MKKIVLAGNPNVGKSVVFSRLTGANVVSSNYIGTTVDVCKGRAGGGAKCFEIIDSPGTYSLEPDNKAEEVAERIIKDADVIVNVCDATNLERNLYLTLELQELGIPMLVSLNMWDEAKHIGIHIDEEKLSKILGVPVIPTVALSGEGIKDIMDNIDNAKKCEYEARTEDERWVEIGRITKEVSTMEHRHHTFKDRFEDLSIRPATGLPLAFGIIFLAFWLVRLIGEGSITLIFDPIFEYLRPGLMEISAMLGPGTLLHDIIIGKLINGEIDYTESLGVLTTGLYVPFAMVLPYIIAFYFVLSILEDTGYLPRLATLVDNIFHKLGMHGFGIIPVFLGMGCNVPGALATRSLETRKQRFIAITLMSISIPCMAQTAMIFGILGPYGLGYIFLVFGTLFVIYVTMGLFLNKVMPGSSPEIFMEIPPYRIPDWRTLFKKTWMRIKMFLTEAIPILFAGIIVISLLYSIGVLDAIGNAMAPIFGIFGLPGTASTALLVGIVRKDLAVGMLLSLGMTANQLAIATVMLTVYFPCIATFLVIFKELGIQDMIKATMIMLGTAFSVAFVLRIILIGF